MGQHIENADFPLLTGGSRELSLSRGDHGSSGYHVCTEDSEGIGPPTWLAIVSAAQQGDAAGVEDAILQSPAAPWWARLQDHLVAIGRIQDPSECRDVWLAAMQRRADW